MKIVIIIIFQLKALSYFIQIFNSITSFNTFPSLPKGKVRGLCQKFDIIRYFFHKTFSIAFPRGFNLVLKKEFKKKIAFGYLVNHGYPRQIEQFDF